MPITPQEANDLRKRVLMGEELSLEDARAVTEFVRGERVAIAEASARKPRAAGSSKKKGMSDEELAASLGSLGL